MKRVLILFALLMVAGPAWAAQTITVMSHDVRAANGLYVVTEDVRVRSGPGTKYKRVSGLKKGDEVRAVGRTDKWLAISQDGETLGFVYAPMLLLVVDGALAEQFTGTFRSVENDVSCDYRFRYEGKSGIEGASFEAADYEVRFRCASREGAMLFYAHMFLTLSPVKTREGVHLIGLDVRSIGDGMEEYLSTRYYYDPKTGKVTFVGHSLPRFAIPPTEQSFQTKEIKEALQMALEASISSWTSLAWKALLKSQP